MVRRNLIVVLSAVSALCGIVRFLPLFTTLETRPSFPPQTAEVKGEVVLAHHQTLKATVQRDARSRPEARCCRWCAGRVRCSVSGGRQ